MLIEAVPDPDPENRFRMRRVIPEEPPSPINLPVGCGFKASCPDAEKCPLDSPQMADLGNGHLVMCHQPY